MRQARMPFQILTLDGELMVEETKDLERRFKDKEWLRTQAIKTTKRNTWHKYKDKYNDARSSKASTITGRYAAARRKAKACGQKWELTQEEWQSLWIDAGFVIIPGTITPSNPRGVRRTAYAVRGPSRFFNTYMARRDAGQPWNKTNCYIGFRGTPLVGSPYHAKEL